MKCRHMTCYQCEDAELVSLREEYEIMREDNARLTKERDETLAEVERLRRDWAATQNALNQTEYECPSEPYTFRGGYIEDASGDRWWSSELLAKVEKERDEARAEVERLRSALHYAQDVNASDLRLLRATEAALDTMHVDNARLTKERDEARAELAHIEAEYEKTNASELTRDALAFQNAALQIKVERLKADLDVVDSDLSLAVKRLTADNNKLYDEKAKLRKALESLLKTSAPHAQWTAAEHEAQIVLEQTGKKW